MIEKIHEQIGDGSASSVKVHMKYSIRPSSDKRKSIKSVAELSLYNKWWKGTDSFRKGGEGMKEKNVKW